MFERSEFAPQWKGLTPPMDTVRIITELSFEYQVLAAIALDLLFGDPRWLPHPVKFIGRFAMMLETPMRRAIKNPRLAGTATMVIVVLTTALAAFGLIRIAGLVHPAAGTVVSVALLYTSLAGMDLARHSMRVYRALRSGDLKEAREKVSWMVGRDTDKLDETGVVRAAVESVAENTVDGVTAPLFYMILLGPVGAIAYKAVSTLDSTFGYKNERYIDFGWASARIDDLAAYIPARLTVPCIALAAALLKLRPLNALRICLRDGQKHSSPNSGLAEAASAGALGIRLGGPLYRKGTLVDMPALGEPLVELDRRQILKINALMFGALAVATGVFIGLRVLAIHVLSGGWQ